ncbi:hypothetical protein DLM78_08810 [Leptospira stimsonii]|uniref:Uncharacterized protein n=1 Tax=Leptospira stimsonii TaxID=2202203 RepID=A0A8B3CP86_9LEPT|nr:hypothetical protein DLM78_08810 [Leptospira stimsonii]
MNPFRTISRRELERKARSLAFLIGNPRADRPKYISNFVYSKILNCENRIRSVVVIPTSSSVKLARPALILGGGGGFAGENRATFLYHKILILSRIIPALVL